MGGMKLAAWLATAALIEGCANAAVGVGVGAPVPGPVAPPGTAAASTGSAGAALGVVLFLGAIDYMNNPQPMPNPADLFMTSPPAPTLSPTRRISEQDCSKPVDMTQGNLRCK